MSSLTWLNNLLLLENFFGIYRTYSNQMNMKKCFIIFHIFIQTVLTTVLIIYLQYLFVRKTNIDQMKLIYILFSISSFLIGVSSVMTGIYYSRDFLLYLSSISSSYDFFIEYLTDVSTLTNSIKKTIYIICSVILLTVSFFTYRSIVLLTMYFPSVSIITLVTVILSQLAIRIIIVLQYLMLYVVITIVGLFIKCLKMLISAAHKRVEINGNNLDEAYGITREQIQEWVELYQDLMNCCKKVTLCFGCQYLYSLVLSIPQYVMVAYQVFYRYTFMVEFITDGPRIIVQLSNMTLMVIPLVAAQLMRNQGVKLQRVLARLYNKMVIGSGEAETKLIKDFIRLIKKNPLEIKFSNKIHAGMYMLPIMFTLIVNYLIILLQFSHVI